jgi:hypothetical protein
VATAGASVLALALTTPWLIELYGIDYTNLSAVIVFLFLAQWLNGSGRPAIRHLAAHWDRACARRILAVSMTVAIASSLPGIGRYGALGAAAGAFAGALLLNGQVIQAAFGVSRPLIFRGPRIREQSAVHGGIGASCAVDSWLNTQ